MWGGKNPSPNSPIRIQNWSNGKQLTGADGTMLQFNFWRSGCYRGRGHAGSRSGGNDGTGGHCGGRMYLNAYVRLVQPAPGTEQHQKSYGICGTWGKGQGADTVNTGLNTGTQSGRRDPPRNIFFKKVKLPGAARWARSNTNARMDFRSFFWCNGNDNQFMNRDNESAEHPANGNRFWNFIEMEQAQSNGAGKFRAMRAKAASLIEKKSTTLGDGNDKDDDVAENEEDEIKKGKDKENNTAPDGKAADDDTGAEVTKKEAEAKCEKKGVKKVNKQGKPAQAWISCVEDVQVVGKDKEMAEQVTAAAGDEEKDDDKTEDENDKDHEKTDKDDKEDQKKEAKSDTNPLSPKIEVCKMGGGIDCSDSKSFTKVVSLPAATFDKKEWNTLKVVLPLKAGERGQIRFAQSETTCECCNDWAIDSLQFLTGDNCSPGAINLA